MANNSISLVSLDFDTLKAQLKQYLKGQAQFSDYDFDGSNMSVLLDILTYNTHLNAFYLNMVASEMFLDSAQLRNSIVSIAKALNYTPRSAKSARANITCTFQQSGLNSFTIPTGTRFTGKNSNGSYTFVTNEPTVLYPSNGVFQAKLAIYEGSLITDAFVTDYSVEGQRFILTNDTIDTDSIVVVVSEDDGQQNTIFQKATSLFGVQSNSAVYFVQATDDSRYEIQFGDGVLGRRPKDGSTIVAQYRITSGVLGNGTTNFVLNDNLGAYNGYGSAIIPAIVVNDSGYGGAEAESLEEIKYRAPRSYQTQERAITTNDFTTLVTQQYQTIKSVYVYGGDQVTNQPVFGTVFVAPITFTGNLLSAQEKLEIEAYLKDRATIGITPSVVDPDYLYIILTTNVTYDSASTTLSPTDIQAAVKQAISTFNTNELTDFNTELKLSKLETAINSSDQSILNNTTECVLKKVFRTNVLQRTFPTISYRNPIVPGTITSSSFLSGGRKYQYTDYNPNLNTLGVAVEGNNAEITNSTNTVYLKDITNPATITYTAAGTCDYLQGTLALNAITLTSLEGANGIEFYAKPQEQDIQSKQNDVITIDIQAGVTVLVRKV